MTFGGWGKDVDFWHLMLESPCLIDISSLMLAGALEPPDFPSGSDYRVCVPLSGVPFFASPYSYSPGVSLFACSPVTFPEFNSLIHDALQRYTSLPALSHRTQTYSSK